MLVGINGDTPLGFVVQTRAETDQKKIKEMTAHQKKIRAEWQTFKNKKKIFERANSFNKPYCLLMTLAWLNDSAPKELWRDRDLQLLMFDKRMRFKGMGSSPTFSSAYYCYNFLPKQIIMRDLNPSLQTGLF